MLTSFQVPANASLLQTFYRFPDLPPEIRVNVWKQALSNIDCEAIRVIINFDLYHPRAIISYPQYVKSPPDLDGEYSDSNSDSNSDFDNTGEAATQGQSPIPALLHVCVESRSITLCRYRLDLYSNIPAENATWWNPQEDTIYFPSLKYSNIYGEKLRRSLFFVQHLALPLRKEILNGFYLEVSSSALYEWILDLPYLKTLSLLVNPFGKYDAMGGRILLYEPYDVPISHLHGSTPSQIEEFITERIKPWKLPEDLPSVEVLVMGFRK